MEPESREVLPGHEVACHFAEKVIESPERAQAVGSPAPAAGPAGRPPVAARPPAGPAGIGVRAAGAAPSRGRVPPTV